MALFDLTDFEWSVIQPLLPARSRGVARVDDRRVLERDILAFADRGAAEPHRMGLNQRASGKVDWSF